MPNNTFEITLKDREAGETAQHFGAPVKPLVVRPRVARQLLGGMCEESLWRLINSGELQSFLQGRARLITLSSIEGLVAKQLAAARKLTTNVDGAKIVDAATT
jgi:hypothetical protein